MKGTTPMKTGSRQMASLRAPALLFSMAGVWRAAGVAALLVAATACAGAPRQKPLPMGRVESGPGTLAEARKFLEGRWALESFEVRPPGKAPIT